MTKMDTGELFAAFDALLDKERAALLGGDLGAVASLVDEKEALLEGLGGVEGGGPDQLGALRSKAMRNQALLDSALQGIRAAASRLGALRRLRRSLETYDQDGRRTTIITRADSRVERRA